jgi:hypothetical protein
MGSDDDGDQPDALSGSVRVAGLRLPRLVAEELALAARHRHRTVVEVIVDVLTAWALDRVVGRRRPPS